MHNTLAIKMFWQLDPKSDKFLHCTMDYGKCWHFYCYIITIFKNEFHHDHSLDNKMFLGYTLTPHILGITLRTVLT